MLVGNPWSQTFRLNINVLIPPIAGCSPGLQRAGGQIPSLLTFGLDVISLFIAYLPNRRRQRWTGACW